jgi:hypothetical protein
MGRSSYSNALNHVSGLGCQELINCFEQLPGATTKTGHVLPQREGIPEEMRCSPTVEQHMALDHWDTETQYDRRLLVNTPHLDPRPCRGRNGANAGGKSKYLARKCLIEDRKSPLSL